jgi:hypothetical protein
MLHYLSKQVTYLIVLTTSTDTVRKSKVVPGLNYASRHEDMWRSRSIASHILELGTRWMQVVTFMPWQIYSLGKSHLYLCYRGLDGAQS